MNQIQLSLRAGAEARDDAIEDVIEDAEAETLPPAETLPAPAAEGTVLPAPRRRKRRRPVAQLRGRQLRHLSESARLEERPDHVTLLAGIWVISGALAALLIWASFATLPEVARGEGQLTPASFERELLHVDGGTLTRIAVISGQTVAAGDEIARFDDTRLQADLRLAERLDMSLHLRAERLAAFVEGREPDFLGGGPPGAERVPASEIAQAQQAYAAMVQAQADRLAVLDEQLVKGRRDGDILRRQIAGEEERLRALGDLLNRREELYGKGLLAYPAIIEARQGVDDVRADLDVLAERLRRNDDSISEIEARLASLISSEDSDARQQLQQVQAEIGEQAAAIVNLRERIAERIIRSPVAGEVKLPDRLAVGDFIGPGQIIGHVVPAGDALLARIRIPAREISGIHIGQEVQLKISALDFIRYGKVEGEIVTLSPGALAAEDGEIYYTAEIALAQDSLAGAGRDYPLLPGMEVQAEIINGTRTIFAYLFKPVKTAVEDAFKEE